MAGEVGTGDELRLELIEDLASLRQLEPQWQELLERLRERSPFLQPAWLLAWWGCFGAQRRLWVVAAWQGGRLMALLPLMLSRERRYGLPLRRLGSLHNDHVQHMGGVVAPEIQAAFHAALFRCLERRGDWDLLELCQFDARSPLLRALAQQAKAAGMATLVWTQSESPYVPLHGDFESYFQGLDKNHRAQLRRRLRKLSQLGKVELRSVRAAEGLDAALAEALELEAGGWKGSAGTAILCQDDLRRFYQDLSRRMAALGALRLNFLCLDGRPIAFEYGLELQGRLSVLKSGYDAAYRVCSPSQILKWLVLEDAFKAGLEELDMLGDREDWKMLWTSHTRPHVWFYLMGSSPLARLFAWLKIHLIPSLKRWRRRRRQAPANATA